VCTPFSFRAAIARAVRDLANSHSKLARVEVIGGDVEVDTMVLEYLKDAVLNIIRNAIDHASNRLPCARLVRRILAA